MTRNFTNSKNNNKILRYRHYASTIPAGQGHAAYYFRIHTYTYI
jgi:hypothetical protein